MKPKTYPNKRTRSQHTYDFYKERQNDTSWRDDYLRVKSIRQRTIIVEITIGIIIVFVGIFVFNELQKQTTHDSNNRVADSTGSSQTTAQNSSSSASSKIAKSKTDSSSTVKQSTTVSNFSRYNKYSGKYIGYANSYTLDFKKGTLTSDDKNQSQVYYFKHVILHPDDSLVINVQSTTTQESPSYLSILLAPANKKITENWQTGASLEDNTDDSTNRFSLAISNNNGKTYSMSPAYNAFSENDTSGSSNTSSYSTIFATTN